MSAVEGVAKGLADLRSALGTRNATGLAKARLALEEEIAALARGGQLSREEAARIFDQAHAIQEMIAPISRGRRQALALIYGSGVLNPKGEKSICGDYGKQMINPKRG